MADYAIHDTTLIGTSSIIRKKEGSSALIDPADYPKRINLMGMLEEKTASSSSICSFSDGADGVPLKNWLVTLPASLDGYTDVNGVQTGKNLFDKTNPNEVDGYFTPTGFSTGNVNAKTIYIPIKGGTTWTVSKTAGQRFQIATAETIPENNATFTSRQADNTNTSLTITASANDKYLWAWVFLDGTDTGTLTDMLASVQIEVGSTPTQYTAYTAPTTYTASLGRTIYGGTADIVTGEGEAIFGKLVLSSENMGIISRVNPNKYRVFNSDFGAEVTGSDYATNILVDGGNLRPQTGSSNDDRCYINASGDFRMNFTNEYNSVADMIADVGTITLIYPLSISTSFTFTPITPAPETALGSNNFWSDQGDTEAVYRSSGTVTPVPIVPTLITKTITANDTYYAEDDGADGYSEVTVDVESVQKVTVHDGKLDISTGTITADSTYCYTDLFDCPSGNVVLDCGEQTTSNFVGLELVNSDSSHANYFTCATRYRAIDVTSYYSATKKARLAFKKTNTANVLLMDFGNGKIYSSLNASLMEEEEET